MFNKMDSFKKKIIVVCVMSIVFLITWSLMYLPARMAINKLKQNLNDVDLQIKQIETVVDQGKNVDQITQSLEEHFTQLDSKLPEREEASLGILSDLARKQNIVIVSTRSQPKTLFMGKDNQQIAIENRICYKFSVALEMKGSYQDLLKYIETLQSSLPSLIVVDRLQISKDPSGTPILNVNMDLNLYLLL